MVITRGSARSVRASPPSACSYGCSTTTSPAKRPADDADLGGHADGDGVDAEPAALGGEPDEPEAVAVALDHRARSAGVSATTVARWRLPARLVEVDGDAPRQRRFM